MCQNFNAFDLLVMAERSGNFDSYIIERNLWDDTFNKLKTEKQPKLHELEEFFNQPPYFFNTIFHSLKLKYRALTTEPSAIEATMSLYQLYASGSPLWTSELTAEEADAVLKHTVGTCALTEEEFNDRYRKALSGELKPKEPLDLRLFWY